MVQKEIRITNLINKIYETFALSIYNLLISYPNKCI
jgi:hypothetical protein